MMGKSKGKVSEMTQDFWTGCQAVDEGCQHCYARAAYQKYGRNFDKVPRTKDWKSPFAWQKKAVKEGRTITATVKVIHAFGRGRW